MKKIILIIATLIMMSFSTTLKCPEDDCVLMWQDTKFCQGMKCRTVEIYKCSCCDKYYQVYVD